MKELHTAPVAFTANASTNNSFKVDERSFELIAPFFLIGLLLLFTYAILRLYLDNRLKNKVVEKNTPENIVALLLRTGADDKKEANLKWFIMFLGLGAALTIIHCTLPLGYHSLAIMAFCIAISFLAIHLVSKNKADRSPIA